jgi:hypothetical protein
MFMIGCFSLLVFTLLGVVINESSRRWRRHRRNFRLTRYAAGIATRLETIFASFGAVALRKHLIGILDSRSASPSPRKKGGISGGRRHRADRRQSG